MPAPSSAMVIVRRRWWSISVFFDADRDFARGGFAVAQAVFGEFDAVVDGVGEDVHQGVEDLGQVIGGDRADLGVGC